MINRFKELMGDRVSPEFLDWLTINGFFIAPASTKYHGSHEGGLYEHSEAVTKVLVDLTNKLNLQWQDPRSPYIIGMFHDLCKIDAYKHPIIDCTPLSGEKILDTTKWEYNTDTTLTGHGDKSVMLLSQHLKLTEEEILCIRYHMGAFTDKEEWKYYGAAIEKYPNVLWTHTADMVASRVIGI